MNNPFNWLNKPKVNPHLVDLNAGNIVEAPSQSAKCEVVEYDMETGLEKWDDCVFVQDFEDSTITAPASLFADQSPVGHRSTDLLDLQF